MNSYLPPLLLLAALVHPVSAQTGKPRGKTTNWPSYAGDKASSKYSPLSQIDKHNFTKLKVAWTWRSVDEEITKAYPQVKTWVWESTPLAVDGALYISTSLSQVASIDAATGKTRWVYDPETWKGTTPPNHGFVHRGVAYWASGSDRRILIGTGDGYLICVDAETGKPVPTFGQQGRIDLTQGLSRPVDRRMYGVTSPPVICRDVVAVGASILDFPTEKAMPPGDLIYPSGRRPTTTTEASGRATAFSATASSAWTRAPESASGTFRWCITAYGTTTCRPRPTSSISG
jgi:quinoprotein glucose dehydrogenase